MQRLGTQLRTKLYTHNVFSTYQKLKETLFQEVKTKNIFVKEIIAPAQDFLTHDNEFLISDKVQFVFLIRNPHHMIISFLNRTSTPPPNFSHRIGCKATFELFDLVQKKAAHKPLLIFSEDLYQNPEETIQRFCSHVQIPYDSHALAWQSLGSEWSGIEEWHQNKSLELTQHWHGAALSSTGFSKPASYEVDEKGEPTFNEIKDFL